MSFSHNSNARMQQKSLKELLTFVEDGSLSHAAARRELKKRGAVVEVEAIDFKFLKEGRSNHV